MTTHQNGLHAIFSGVVGVKSPPENNFYDGSK